MNRREFLKTTGAGLAVLSLPGWLTATADESANKDKPNIILILSDDVGIADIGCYGGPHKTPRIDELAKGGTRFEQCYATPLCGPSRCQLLTGRYPFRTGLINNNSQNAVKPGREIMIPTVMSKAGYATASVGKWGQICLGPGQWGFDEFLVFPGSGRYWREQTTTYRVNGQVKDLAEGQYLPDIMHDFAADFIGRHKDKPFFLYYPMSHVHGPIVRTPDSKGGGGKGQLYEDNIAYMDKLVGKLIDELDRQHLRDKTLVLFAGDNGTAAFGIQSATINGQHIFGRKNTMREGGSRVPLIANWPGVTPVGAAKSDLIDFSDFFATAADLGGAKLPDGVKLDSHSFAPQLKGAKGDPREWVYVELDGKSYVRNDRFKLTNGGELFDMKDAPFNEISVPADSAAPDAIAARKRLERSWTSTAPPPLPPASLTETAPGGAYDAGRRRCPILLRRLWSPASRRRGTLQYWPAAYCVPGRPRAQGSARRPRPALRHSRLARPCSKFATAVA